MREIFALIRKIAENRSSVLITGESGTGKELVARTIYFSGSRREEGGQCAGARERDRTRPCAHRRRGDSPEDLPLGAEEEIEGEASPESLARAAVHRRMSLEQLCDLYIDEILQLTGGNKVQTARILGITRRTP
jgi:DNA-binding NtrC family response regulator